MQTSVIFLRADLSSVGRSIRGFTLLELMVVLVVLALGATMATPALMRLADRLGERNQEDQLSLFLQNLPVAVMNRGSEYVIEATGGYVALDNVLGQAPVPLPEFSGDTPRIWIPHDIRYRPNGACTGGTMYWELGSGQRITHELEAPLCRPRSDT